MPPNAAAVGRFANTLANGDSVTLRLCGPNLPAASIVEVDWTRSGDPVAGESITYASRAVLGDHDEVEYLWSVDDPGDHVTLTNAGTDTATVALADDAPLDYLYRMRLQVTVGGTGTAAADGTEATDSLERDEAVVAPPLEVDAGSGYRYAPFTHSSGQTRYRATTTATALNALGPVSYAWTGTHFPNTASTRSVTGNGAATARVTCTATDEAGRTDSDSANIAASQ